MRSSYQLLLMLLFASLFAHSQTRTWTGATSSDWNTASNWSGSTVPVGTDAVVIPNVTNDPVLDMARTVASLSLSSGALLDLSGFALTSTGVATITSATIQSGTLFSGGLTTSVATMNVTVNSTGNTLSLSGSQFKQPITVHKQSSSSGTSSGNTFDSLAVFYNDGSGSLTSGAGTRDVFNAGFNLYNTSSGPVYLAHSTTNNRFEGPCKLLKTGTGAIHVGQGSGTAFFANTVALGCTTGTAINTGIAFYSGVSFESTSSLNITTEGFSGSSLLFSGAVCTPSISLTLSGSALFNATAAASFNGATVITAPCFSIATTTFNSAVELIKTANIDDICSGPITCNGAAIIRNSSTKVFRFNSSGSGDHFNQGLTTYNTGAGSIQPFYSAGGNITGTFSITNSAGYTNIGGGQLSGNIALHQSGGSVTIGALTQSSGYGLSSDTLKGNLYFNGYKQLGTGIISIIGNTTSVFSSSTTTDLAGSFSITAGYVYLAGTFGELTAIKNGPAINYSTGSIICHGLATLKNTASGWFYLKSTSGNQFEQGLSLYSTAANGFMVVASDGVATISGTLALYCSAGTISLGSSPTVRSTLAGNMELHITGGSTSLYLQQASGYSIISDTLKGGLNFACFKQLGNSAITILGTPSSSFSSGAMSEFLGNLTVTAGYVFLAGTFGQLTAIKNGPAINYSTGPIVCHGLATLKNTASGWFYLKSTSGNQFEQGLSLYSTAANGFMVVASDGVATISGTLALYCSAGSISLGSTSPTIQSTLDGNMELHISGGGTTLYLQHASGYSVSSDTLKGALNFAGFKQHGSSTINLFGTPSSSFTSGATSEFAGNLTVTAGHIFLGGTFLQQLNATKNGGGNDYGAGSIICHGVATIKNTSYGIFVVDNSTSSSTFYDNVRFETTGSVAIEPCRNGSLILHKNLIYAGTAAIGSIANAQFVGTTDQYIQRTNSLSPSITNLTLNKASGKVYLQTPLTVSGTLTLTSGALHGGSSDLLTLSTVSGGSSASYIDAPVLKTGTTAFTFPLGSGGNYAPLSIAAVASSTTFKARYFGQDPDSLYPRTNKQSTVGFVNRCGNWNLDRTSGTGTTTATLGWDNNPCYASNPIDAYVTAYQSGQWKHLGNSAYTGNSTTGTVKNTTAFTSYPQVVNLGGLCWLTAGLTTDLDTLYAGFPVSIFSSPLSQANYKFYINNSLLQNSSSSGYTSSTLVNGDSVKVIIQNADLCKDTSARAVNIIASPPPFFRSSLTGNWNASSWQTSTDSVTWHRSNAWPDYRSAGVFIRNGHTVTLTNTTAPIELTGNLQQNGSLSYATGSRGFSLTGNNRQFLISADTLRINKLKINKTTSTPPVILSGSLLVNDSLSFTKGNLITSEASQLVFADGALALGATDSSYVEGFVKKKGNDAFSFPVGRNGHYKPISFSAPSTVTDAFVATYKNEDSNPTYSHSSKDGSLNAIETNEYWILNRTAGSSNVTVTLGWDDMSCQFATLANLKVTAWDGSQWKNKGNGGTTGTTSSGTVSSNGVSSIYGAFTLGTTDAFTCVKCYADAGNDTSILQWQGIRIGQDSLAGNSYQWKPIDGLRNPEKSKTICNPESSKLYLLEVVNSIGCKALDQIHIEVIPRETPPSINCVFQD